MPRPKKPGAPEPKRRSRNGCWPCKNRKVKCGEERPGCINCAKSGLTCDYTIRLNWEGRGGRHVATNTLPAGQSSPRGVTASSFQFVEAKKPLLTSRAANRPLSLVNHTFTVNHAQRAQLQLPIVERWTGEEQSVQVDIENDITGSGRIRAQQLGERDDVSEEGESTDAPLHMVNGSLSVTQPPPPPPPQYFQPPHKRSKSDIPPEYPDSALPSKLYSFASPISLGPMSPPAPTRFPASTSFMSIGSPPTPATPSSYSDDEHKAFSVHPQQPPTSSSEIRRLSVSSLLSGPPGPIPLQDAMSLYGFDLGKRDEDVGHNDDANAISLRPPTPPTPREQSLAPSHGSSEDILPFDFRYSDQPQAAGKGSGGYYKAAVPINIPRRLEPLPDKLRENPMNLLYFHHFLDHTARVLMPYDDQQSNPFRTILPQMAVKNSNLLSLLLAYSASHRAKLLQQKEPEMRIAHWVEDIFPTLRESLSHGTETVSNESLATAIMLASLEIISPKAFGYPISWQEHLNLARDLMRNRLASLRRMHSSSREDQVCSFLWSWFAYLDVLGGLSGGPRRNDSSTWLGDYIIDEAEDPDEIDCIMGFTNRCVRLLAQTAELARVCDFQRIGRDHRVISTWMPDPDVVQRAMVVESELLRGTRLLAYPCKHIGPHGMPNRDRAEMAATNEAFHWAALIHLHRRVLGKPSDHEHVQLPVQNILKCLRTIRPGVPAETGFLFPLFTAGCETSDVSYRDEILERFKSVESNGMAQVHRAKKLMQKVWECGHPWETLLKNEFIG